MSAISAAAVVTGCCITPAPHPLSTKWCGLPHRYKKANHREPLAEQCSYCQQSKEQSVFVSVMGQPAQTVVYNASNGNSAPGHAATHMQSRALQASTPHQSDNTPCHNGNPTLTQRNEITPDAAQKPAAPKAAAQGHAAAAAAVTWLMLQGICCWLCSNGVCVCCSARGWRLRLPHKSYQ
jgi:hypothetical protein